MLSFIKKLFGFSSPAAPEVQNQSAPYKLPEPAATTPIPMVVEVAPVEMVVEGAGIVKVPAAKKPRAKKPAGSAPKKPKAK